MIRSVMLEMPEEYIPEVSAVIAELQRAQKRFATFHSAHEGYAVILEEADELWAEIRTTKWDNTDDEKGAFEPIRKEAIQLCAMAMRFLVDIVPLSNIPF